MISTDEKVFDEESAVYQRMQEYGGLVDELHIIVLSENSDEIPNSKFQMQENTFAYPTNSWSRWLYPFDAAKIGKKIIEDWEVDIENSNDLLVTTQDPFATGFAGWSLKRQTGGRLQMQVHTDFLNPYFRKLGFMNMIRSALGKYLLPKADCIRVVSERVKRAIENSKLDIENSNISVLPIYTDTSHIQDSDTEFDLRTTYPYIDPIILVVARLEPEKNVGLALQAFKRVRKTHSSAGLLIVGDGSKLHTLRKKAKELGLETAVQFAGWQNDLAPFYQSADVYLHTADFEGYGRTLVEAAAAACPIVTTDVGLVGDMLEDFESALVCEPRSAGCLAEKINWALANEDMTQKIAKTAQIRIQDHLRDTKDNYLQDIKNGWQQCG
jgi:glycosyltransferase involved in cell wall biosynthesis